MAGRGRCALAISSKQRVSDHAHLVHHHSSQDNQGNDHKLATQDEERCYSDQDP